jgi:hypothetical protein
MQQFMRIFILLAAAAAAAAAAGDPLNVRPGLWETTSTGSTTVTGTPMGPDAATLNAMTPEQRTRMEAALKGYASGQPTVRTNRSCVTPEQVAKGLENLTGAPTPRCNTEVLQKAATDYRFRQRCSEGGSGHSAREVTLHLDSPRIGDHDHGG